MKFKIASIVLACGLIAALGLHLFADDAAKPPKAPDTFKAKFETTRGTFVVEVKREWSPNGADRLMARPVEFGKTPIGTSGSACWRDWYRNGMVSVERDLSARAPRLALAAKHQRFLLHWDREKLASAMGMLRDACIGPFSALQSEASTLRSEAPTRPDNVR